MDGISKEISSPKQRNKPLKQAPVLHLVTPIYFFTGYALNCITCNSAINSECGDPFTANQEKYLAKCEPEETYCGKTVSTENVRTRKYTVHFGYNEIQYDKTPLVMYLYSPGNTCIKLS